MNDLKEVNLAPVDMEAMLASMNLRVACMDADDKRAFLEIMDVLLSVQASDEGAAVIMADRAGDGQATMAALGNQLLIAPLLFTAAEVGRRVFTTPEGEIH